MLLIIAFACFALLFAGWIVAPNTSSSAPVSASDPTAVIPEPGTAHV